MMSHISSSAQLNTIDELSGKVMNFISTVFNFVLPESVKEVLQNRAVQGIMKVTGGVTQITAGCGLCTTLAGAFAGVPMIILGANVAIEGIQDLWHAVKGDLDVKSKNLLKEATGHKVDNIVDLAELVSTVGSAKAASKTSSKAFAEAQSKLGKALNKARNKAREIETVVSEKARLLNRAARQFIRRECGNFRLPKRVAKPVDFGRLFKKHGVKTAPGPGLQPLSEAELEKVVGGAKDLSWRPGGAVSAEKPKAPGLQQPTPKPAIKVQSKAVFDFGKYSTKIDSMVTVVEKAKLPEALAKTFTDGQYRTVITNEEITVYRVFGYNAKSNGTFATTAPIGNAIQAKIDCAILPEWKNSLQYEAEIVVPKGTVLNIGKVEEQFTLSGARLAGNADQVLLPFGWDDLNWIKSIREIRVGGK